MTDGLSNPTPAVEPAEVEDEFELRQYLAVLLRRRGIVGAVTMVAMIVGLALSFLPSPLYESEAMIQLSEQSAPAYATPVAVMQLFATTEFLRTAATVAGLSGSPRDLRGMVTAGPVRDTRLIRVRVRHRDPQKAYVFARVLVDRFMVGAGREIGERQRMLRQRLEGVERQLVRAERLLAMSQDVLDRRRSPAGSPDGFAMSLALNAAAISQDLLLRLQQTRAELHVELLNLRLPAIVEHPTISATPVSPRRALILAAAAVTGVLAGMALTFVTEYFSLDPRTEALPRVAPADRGNTGL